jgi:L-asparaginase
MRRRHDARPCLYIAALVAALTPLLGCGEPARASAATGARDARDARPADAAAQLPAAAASGPEAAPPRVRMVATGGTISNRRGGRLTAQELVRALPGVERYVRPEFEQFANTSSASLTLAQWLELARRLNTLYRSDPDLAGLVVTSGTDTLEELAWFLHLTVRDPRPVVVTGAMRTPDQAAPDGEANLLAAFRVAADPDARGRGVLVVLNDEIHTARDVTKSDAQRLHTFVERAGGRLGVVDQDRVIFSRSIATRHTVASEFDVFAIDALPRVDVLLVYQGADGDLVKAAVDLGARGIVLATAGAGAMSGTQRDGVRYALEQGRPVVFTTRAGAGRVPAQRPSGAGAGPASTPRIGGEDHTPVKARVLLMLAIAAGLPADDLQRVFTEY